MDTTEPNFVSIAIFITLIIFMGLSFFVLRLSLIEKPIKINQEDQIAIVITSIEETNAMSCWYWSVKNSMQLILQFEQTQIILARRIRILQRNALFSFAYFNVAYISQ